MSKTKLLLSTATLLALSAPAFAANDFEQLPVGAIQMNSGNVGLISFGGAAAGPSQGTFLNQTAGNTVNAIGPTAYVGVVGDFTVQQGAGNYTIGNNPVAGTLGLTASNLNTASTAGTLLSTLQVGGSQSSSNAVNVANLQSVTPGAAGTLSQAVNVTGGNVANLPAVLSANNLMSGTVQNGNVTVGNGTQGAYGTLNSASFAGTTSLSLDATQKFGFVAITDENGAYANSVASGSSTLDPSIVNLGQVSNTSLNSLSFQSATANTPLAVSLNGGQGQVPNTSSSVTFGNTAAAYTGPTNPITYNVANGQAGTGTVQITGTIQQASVSLNSVSGDANTSIALSGSDPQAGFTQTANGAQLALNTPTPAGLPGNAANNFYPGIVNGMVANTGTGNASISGTVTNGMTDAGQTFKIGENSISANSLSGNATQSASNISSLGGNPVGVGLNGYINAAVANTTTGNSSISNLAQSGSQLYNTVSANSATNLSLTQTSNTVGLAGGNVQLAMASGNTSITGANQSSTLGVNIANVGIASGTSIAQTSNGVSMNNGNLLSTSGPNLSGVPYNSQITGTQTATNSVNVIGH